MGAPRIQGRIYAHLRSNPGELFRPKEIAKALGFTSESITSSLRGLCKKHPTTMVRNPIGTTGRLASFGYRTAMIANKSGSKAVNGTDVLVTIPVGDNKSATLTAEGARKVYQQLHALFGGK